MTDILPGDLVTISVVFTNKAGALTDPTAVTLTIQGPDAASTTPTPVHDSTGKYHYDLAIAKSGRYSYRWLGTGTVAEAAEGVIVVAPSLILT